MKQLQFAFKEDDTLIDELKKIRQWVRSGLCSTVLIQIYTEILNKLYKRSQQCNSAYNESTKIP